MWRKVSVRQRLDQPRTSNHFTINNMLTTTPPRLNGLYFCISVPFINRVSYIFINTHLGVVIMYQIQINSMSSHGFKSISIMKSEKNVNKEFSKDSDNTSLKRLGRQRQYHKPKGLMNNTVDMHMRQNKLCLISVTSFAKQKCEMTKWRTWTHDNACLEFKFLGSSATWYKLNRWNNYKVVPCIHVLSDVSVDAYVAVTYLTFARMARASHVAQNRRLFP